MFFRETKEGARRSLVTRGEVEDWTVRKEKGGFSGLAGKPGEQSILGGCRLGSEGV